MSDRCSSETGRSVPTPEEGELTGTLEKVARTGHAQCRLCDHVVNGDSFGEIFQALAEHGEEAHEWDNRTGWSVGPETNQGETDE
ncbi:hypothetical protein [Natronosalvus amylolyticus]|uniref:hypothetical protein n=1 Tax=Natronosalvus amylolyticus TaxID=2961994 RepID=UPI0020C98BFE|nr:hypothetical protein [Natronosalvus amylolyticus]